MIERIKIKIEWVKSPDFLAGLTLFFGSLLFFYDLFQGRFLLTERDLAPYFIPPRFFWVESLLRGDFPLWNPYQFTGHPFFANPQHTMLYPLNFLFLLFPFDIAFNGVIILHFFLGGFFTYLLLKDLKASSTGALISGLIFMLCGYLLSVHSLLTILLSSIWTPLIMMFFRRAINSNVFRNEIFTAVLITISFLGGGIEIVYGNFFVLLFMVLFFTSVYRERINDVSEPLCGLPESGGPPRAAPTGVCSLPIYRGRIKPFLKSFRSLLTIAILFLFLSAIQLIPFVELFHHSIRGRGITYQEATIWSFAPKDVLLFFLPDAYGYFLDMKKYWVTQCWFKTLYTGGLPFILSAIYFIFGKERKLFSILMLFSIFLSLGHYNPLYSFVFKYLPFFNGIRYPAKFLYIFILVLAITAGLGFDKLVQFSKDREKKGLKHLLIVFSLISGVILLFLVLGHKEVEHFLKLKEIDFPRFNHLSVNLYHTKRFLFYITLFFLLLRVGYEVGWKGWTKILLLFFLTADLFGNMGFYGKEKSSDFFKKTRILEIVTSEKDSFRVMSTAKTIAMDSPVLIGDSVPFDLIKEKHIPSLNMIFRVHDIWGIDVVRLKRCDDLYKAFTTTPSISATNLADLYGVKYVVSITPIEEDPRFELVYARLEGLGGNKEDLLKQNTIKLYRNRNPLQRAWLVKEFKVIDSKEIFTAITHKDFDPRKVVYLEEEQKWEKKISGHKGLPLQNINDVGKPRRGPSNRVEFISETNNKLSLMVETETDGILVLSDTFYPGWKVFVNGKEGKILRANYNFRALIVPEGVSRVDFFYRPMSFKLGLMMTLMGILICGALWRMDRKKDGRR